MKAYIGLTCKAGGFSEVLKKLLHQQLIDQQDIFLLFGPFDILIKIANLQSLEEFIEKYFNPVRLIGVEDNLITKTLSFIVATEGPSISESPFAFVFLNVQPKHLDNVHRKLLGFPEVLSADTVFGPYDIICSVKALDQMDLLCTVTKIQEIPGVENSVTSVVSPIPIFPEW
ncbi:MAG: Lrp/AsnC ligand binding domain-containing protein [Candidatus Bathyarchaeota archaeon]|nr:Lrp/AsnC ligand binding domain-containing protein [Candidatus Bathyarchaeota archaeon]